MLASVGNISYANELLAAINTDGGYGVERKYTSDPYDTALVMEAFESLGITGYNSHIEKIVNYFIASQNSDEGWGYNECNETDETLTARIAYDILKYLSDNLLNYKDAIACVTYANDMLSSVDVTDMNEDKIELAIYNCLLKQQLGDYTGVYDILDAIENAQSDNGSFYDDFYYTHLVVKYLNSISEIESSYNINDIVVNLDKDIVYVNNTEKITGEYTISYDTAVNKVLTLTTTIYDGDKSVYEQETAVNLDKNETVAIGASLNYTVDFDDTKTLKVVSVISNGTDNLKEYANYIYIREHPVEPKTEVTNASMILSDHYGYVGEPKTITSGYRLLYVTNIKRIIEVRTTVYCDDKVVYEDVQQAILIPNETNIE